MRYSSHGALPREDIAIARRFYFAVIALLWLGCVGWAKAQSAPAQQTPAQPGAAGQGLAQVRLGQATAPLYGPWKFQVGDSPLDPGDPCAAVGPAGV